VRLSSKKEATISTARGVYID